jgi:hypothetical protein
VDTGSPQKMRPSKEIERFQEKWNPVFRPKVRAKKREGETKGPGASRGLSQFQMKARAYSSR